MIQKKFPQNTILESMAFSSLIGNSEGDLVITFKKGQVRTYHNVPKELAYQLYYKSTAKETLAFYSNNIKKKFKVTVK